MNDKYLEVQGVRTRYRDTGAGEVLVLLHGISRSLEDWQPSATLFAKHYRVVSLDLVGFGRSDKPDAPYSFPYFAAFLKTFLDALELERVTLLGSSLGGGVALQTAILHPERVRALVLIGSAGFGREVSVGLRLCAIPLVGEWLSRPSHKRVEGVLKEVFYDRKLVTPEAIETGYELASLPGTQRAFLKATRALGTPWGLKKGALEPLERGCATLKTPTLILWGQHDKILPVAHAENARRLLPHARIEILENCGHFPQYEQPERVTGRVIEFLGKLDSPK